MVLLTLHAIKLLLMCHRYLPVVVDHSIGVTGDKIFEISRELNASDTVLVAHKRVYQVLAGLLIQVKNADGIVEIAADI